MQKHFVQILIYRLPKLNSKMGRRQETWLGASSQLMILERFLSLSASLHHLSIKATFLTLEKFKIYETAEIHQTHDRS